MTQSSATQRASELNNLDHMLQRNKEFAARQSAEGTLMPSLPRALPNVKAIVIGCADMRVDPADLLGIKPGEAVVMRNIGGRITPGLLEELGLLGRIGEVAGEIPGGGGEFHIIVLQHTDCGITRLVGDPAKLAHYFQIQEGELKTKAVTDPRAAVAFDVAALRAIPALPGLGLYQASSTTWRPDLSRSWYRQRRFVLRKTPDSRPYIDRSGQLSSGRQTFPYQIMEELPVIRPQSRIYLAESPVNTTRLLEANSAEPVRDLHGHEACKRYLTRVESPRGERPMDNMPAELLNDYPLGRTSRRKLLWTLGAAAVGAHFASFAFGQGQCRDGYGTKSCPLNAMAATAPIKPVFAPTGWKTVALDHITFQMPDYQKEAAFYIALMGWNLRSDDGNQAVLDIGNWGSAIFKQAPKQLPAVVENFCFVVEPWNAKTVQVELQKRGLKPVAENDGQGFESFHVKDPDGWDLQICNSNGLTKARNIPATAKLSAPPPFESTGWETVWLDHLSFEVTNYKESASFYSNLLGWKETYDEGSQHELMIGEVGDVIVRGGNPNSPDFGKGGTARARSAQVDHISFGISHWDTDGVKAALEKRGLEAEVDTSTRDDIHVAAYKSYHTTTPNGYNLQISYVTHDERLTLANAVKPKPTDGR